MKLRQFYQVFRKSLDLKRRARAAFEEGTCICESCGHAVPLAGLEPLTILACPKCGGNGLVPHRLNGYLLYEPLGAGGMSSVYKAVRRDTLEEMRLYAVKLLRRDRAVDEAVRREFLDEADIHRAVSSHPNIVTFIECAQSGDEFFHVMDYVPGHSVKHRVEEAGRIPETLALRWLQETADALRHIRDHGYLYRDISPGNLLTRQDDAICLIDFGLALPLDRADAANPDQPLVGTPEFMPPERIQRLGEDERSSIYSLGLLLFYMLKGENLIKADSHEKAAIQHVSSVRVAFNARMLPADCSPGVVALIARMIKYDPVDRPASLEELQQALAGLAAS